MIEQESGWHTCAVSGKGAVGLMQLMPETAQRLGVQNRCDVKQNISGGIRYLAWLNRKFHGDLRLVAASYYAGEHNWTPRWTPNGYIIEIKRGWRREWDSHLWFSPTL